MNATKVIDMDNDGLNMAADGSFLYIRGGRDMYIYDFADFHMVARNTVFKKDGKARSFALCEKYIYLLDFCDLYILDKMDLKILDVLRLGENLSSDLCAVRFGGGKAYISVRNGKMVVMDTQTKAVEKFEISTFSSWDHTVFADSLYIATINGELIEINANDMRITRTKALCKKNIYSVIRHENMLYTVSQDKTIKAVNADTLETYCTAKNAVKGMTRILGVYGDWLVIADGGVSLWDRQSLKLYEKLPFPTGHFNKGALLYGNCIIGSDYKSVYKHAL